LGNNKEIEKVLVEAAKGEDTKIEKDALEVLVQNAKGSYRDALSLLDVVYSGQLKDGNAKKITKKEVSDVLGIPDIDVVYLLIKNLLKGDGATALDLLHDLEAKGSNLQQFTSFVLETLRGVLTEKIRGNLSEKNSFAKELSMRDLMTLIRLFLDAEGKMKYANDQLLVLELIIPEMMKEEPVEDKQQIVNTDVKNKIEEVKEEKVETKDEPKEEAQKESLKQVKKELKEQKQKEASEEDEEEEESSSDIPRAKGNVSFDEIQKNWESFVKELKPFNGHLSAFMNSANLVSFANEELEVEVPFDFYKDRIEIPKSREIISNVFSKMFGSRCKIVCSVNESIKPKKKSTPDFVLRNLPEQKKEAPKENSNNSGGDNPFRKSRKISAEVEAIFEGM
jgi:DNA polymerase-3 subunit gamma/tau